MMRRILLLLLAGAATLATPRPARAWDELGHKVVARIAWDHMTPQARQRAVALLMAAPAGAGLRELMPADSRPQAERERDLFVNAAYWPDMIRTRSHPGNRFAHADWHYVNIFWEQATPGAPPVERPDRGTAGELIVQERRIVPALGDVSRPDSAQAVDLAWLLHLVADAHQPLHNSARITPQDPEGDRGGNLFLLAGLYPFNNLHSYWDSLVGFSVPWAAEDRSESDYVGSVAARIAARHPLTGLRTDIRLDAFEDWSREGERVAQRAAFPAWLGRGQRAPLTYRMLAWSAAEGRVALAGYRLAGTLNRAFGG